MPDLNLQTLLFRVVPKYPRFHFFVTFPAVLILVLLFGANFPATFLWSHGSTRCYAGWDSDQFLAGYYRIAGFTLPPVPPRFIMEPAGKYVDASPGSSSVYNRFFIAAAYITGPRSTGVIWVRDWEIVVLLLIPLIGYLARETFVSSRWKRRTLRNLCPACGYDVRENPDKCSECGSPRQTGRIRQVPRWVSSRFFYLSLLIFVISIFLLAGLYQRRLEAANIAFFDAMDRADYSTAMSLLDHISSPNIADMRGRPRLCLTALNLAVVTRQHDLLRGLLKRHPLTDREIDTPPLVQAIEISDVETVRILLDAGESADKPVVGFGTPLNIAVEAGRSDMVELLLSRDASTMTENEDGRTPLHLAQIELNDLKSSSPTPEIKEWMKRKSTIIRLLEAHDASTRPQ